MKIKLQPFLIAPCGMNCGLCMAYLRQNNPCHGCYYAKQNLPITRARCHMRICKKRKGKFCYTCPDFPCDRLKHLDNRYRTRYHLNEIENLEYIRDNGMKKFLAKEEKKWRCLKCGRLRCCHNGKCYTCDKIKSGKG